MTAGTTSVVGVDRLELASRLRLIVARLARRLRQQASSGLSPSQLTALASIHKAGPMTLGTLAEIERVAPPTITKVVDKLTEAGLVERSVDPSDRRFVLVAATAAGKATIDKIRAERNAWLSARLDALSPEDVERLALAVDALAALAEDET